LEIQLRRHLPCGQKILVAVSGGLDSMTLLYALEKLATENRWRIVVAHFNHQLRGRSSDADEKLVRKTAAALKLPVIVGRSDVKSFAKKSRLSIEMAARKLRHEFLARTAREQKITAVALAHHADDQVEQFFLRLLRGAGGAGMAGMKGRSPSPVDSKISLIRPLLNLSKGELREFARQNKIIFREDATNVTNDALRNRIRNELLPLLRKKYQPGLNKTVLRLMEITGAESDFVGEAAQNVMSNLRPDPVRRQAERCNFGGLSIAVQRRVLQAQLISLGLAADFELIESLRQSTDILISAGPKFFVMRDATGKVNLQTQPFVRKFNPNELVVNVAGEAGEVIFNATRVNWKIDASKRFRRSRGETGREFFDAHKIGNQITLRHWRPGDCFQPIGLKSAAKLQDLFTNAKIPRDRRRGLIVGTVNGGEIFWVEGLRISENFKLTPETKRRLVWRWRHL
jgi:tRNA(Ile)-lysidine synthase